MINRRAVLRLSALAPLLAAAACGEADSTAARTSADPVTTPSGSAEPGAFPVSIEHAFGTTTVVREPTRVVTVGWSDQDFVAALGVVPAGAVKVTWGGNERGSTDWFDARISELDAGRSASQIVRYDDTDGLPVDEIAEVRPDLILGTNSGMTKEEYERLSRIAPTLAYPEAPWTTPWRTSAEMIGRALGRSEEAKAVITRTEQVIADTAAAHPRLEGTTVAWGWVDPKDMSTLGLYGTQDLRPQILREFGMKDPEVVTRLSEERGTFDVSLSAERASELDADVFIFYLEDGDQLEKLVSHPLLSAIPAVAKGQYVASADKAVALAMSSPTPLSMPVAASRFMPKVATAADGTPVTQ